MQREIMTSIPFLSQPSTEALNTPEDLAVAQDLKDTLDAHRNGCVGMAANMIGVSKSIIAFVDEDFGGRIFVMFNPTITAKDGVYSFVVDGDAEIEVKFTEITHAITCSTEGGHGSVSADKTAAKAGETVTLTLSPAEGKSFDAAKKYYAMIQNKKSDHCEGIII